MDINPTIIISSVTALVAIIAPVITTYLNNKTQLRLKNIDMFYKEKSDAYQKFCTDIALVLDNLGRNNEIKEYKKAHQLAYLMSDNKTRALLDELETQLQNSINKVESKALVSKL